MRIESIGVMSPGDMGQAIAQQLKQKGFSVCTALERRSERSKALARQAGLTDVGSLDRLTECCDVILSIMNPGAALEFGRELAQALAMTHRRPLFVDCNAIAPVTMQEIEASITAAGGRCADGSIIGPPPRGAKCCWLYVSGSEASPLQQLATPQLAVNVLSDRIGDASALKMCYATITKGVGALVLELLIAGRRLGIGEALEAQIKQTERGIYDAVVKKLPVMPPKAYRWVPEMNQIARCLESIGMTPRMMQGAADIYEFVAATSLGKETPENCDVSRTGEEVVRLLADEHPVRPRPATVELNKPIIIENEVTKTV
jgi:3-hydroxyisobutyrate dehydrogenase-like beta-hydroxyacid dehydrogenase